MGLGHLNQTIMEYKIGKEVSESILEHVKAGFAPEDVILCYVSACGAGISMLWEEATREKVRTVFGSWGADGFTSANLMDLDPDEKDI